jgi:periplasmic protein CpxP/Spy
LHAPHRAETAPAQDRLIVNPHEGTEMSRTHRSKPVYTVFSALALAAAGALLVLPAEAAAPGYGMMGQGGMTGCDMQGEGRHGQGMHGKGMHGKGMHSQGPMTGMGGPGMARMLDGIDATEAQRTQIAKIMENARTEMAGQREAGQALRAQMMDLFAQPTVDAAAVETLRKQMQAHREVGSQRMTQAMVEASQVLTPEQRQQIAERMTQRRGTMEQQRQHRHHAPRQRS